MIELLIVMAIITILVSMAVPFYQKSIIRSKESVLRNNLFTMRTVIDEFTMDKGKAPQPSGSRFRRLSAERPRRPDDRSDQSWKVIMEDATTSVNQSEPGSSTSGADQTRPASKALRTPSGDEAPYITLSGSKRSVPPC